MPKSEAVMQSAGVTPRQLREQTIINAIAAKLYELFSTRQSGCILDSDAYELYTAIAEALEERDL